MKFDSKWIKVMALALSYPSTILFLAWGLMELVREGVLGYGLAVVIFLLVVVNTIYLLVVYAFKNKNKP